MVNSIEKYNNLNGVETTRGQIRKIITQANQEGRKDIAFKLQELLKANKDYKLFNLNIENLAIGEIHTNLNGIDFIEDEDEGLGKPVSSSEIYDYVTKMVIDLIESGKELVWRKQWKKTVAGEAGTIATNYSSKMPYRGINYFLLNMIIPMVRGKNWDNPYFLTFKQIEAYKGKLKKGSVGYKVVYFTKLYSYKSAKEKIDISSYNKSKFIKLLNASKASILKSKSASQIADNNFFPILKYYNVFSADDISGIDFKLTKIDPIATEEKIEIAEAIVSSMPKAPVIKKQGTEAFYMQAKDLVNIPKVTTFKAPQFYYSTLFHELIHSTKHPKRLNDSSRGGKQFGDLEYSKEELVAELGASFLNAEAGILHHNLNNTAAYLKGWKKRLLTFMKEDNKFFFRAASKAQAAADFILDRNEKGEPSYIKHIIQSNTVVENIKKEIEANDNVIGFGIVDNISGEIIASKKTLKELENVNNELKSNKVFKSGEILVYEIILKNKKNILGKKVKVNWSEKKQKVNKKTKQIALFGNKKQKKALEGLGFISAASNLEAPKDIFHLKGAIGDFIQDIQPHQALILIKGTKHTSKSQLAMQVAEGASLTGRKVAYVDYEQGGLESKDTIQSLDRNTTPVGRENIFVKGYIENPMEELQNIIQFVDVIVADSVTDLGISADQLNFLRKNHPKVIWCFISQVKENGEMYGGNKMAHNPTAIIQCHPHISPEGRYATLEKNRGNDLSLCYDIFLKKVFVFKELEETDENGKKNIQVVRSYK